MTPTAPATKTSTATKIDLISLPMNDGQVTYSMSTTEITIHRRDSNPVFGELNIKVRLEDEAAGAFISLSQSDNTTPGEIRLDFEEIELIAEAAKALLNQNLTYKP